MKIIMAKKRMGKITVSDIELAVARYFNIRKNLIVPNISWGLFDYEMDLFILTNADFGYEVEIKITKTDLIKDKLKPHKHCDIKIRKLYFAIPEHLLEHKSHIPEEAGILVIEEKSKKGRSRYGNKIYHEVRKEREAKVKSNYKFTNEERYKVARLGLLRVWRLKEKLADKK